MATMTAILSTNTEVKGKKQKYCGDKRKQKATKASYWFCKERGHKMEGCLCLNKQAKGQ